MTALADGVGVGVHYNTLIPWRGHPNPGGFTSFKYGVIGGAAPPASPRTGFFAPSPNIRTVCAPVREHDARWLAANMHRRSTFHRYTPFASGPGIFSPRFAWALPSHQA